MEAWASTLLSLVIVSAISFVGAAAGFRLFRRHAVVLTLVALAAGALLGDAVLHLIPEAVELRGGFDLGLGIFLLAGFLLFFFLEAVLRYGHAHGEHSLADPHDHHGDHHPKPLTHPVVATRTPPRTPPPPPPKTVAPFGWMNLAGDGLHNFVDGVVVAAAYSVDFGLGLATTVAVALHEIPQELGDFAVLVRAGFSAKRALMWNFASALMAILGAVLFLLLPFDAELLQAIAIPITAGGFLYIAAADLVPELHHHVGDRHTGLIVTGLLVGLGLMFGLLGLEAAMGGHAHEH